MKFNLKRMLGLLALGGAAAYIQKKGGLKNAGQSLKDMFQEKLGNRQGVGQFGRSQNEGMGMRDTGMGGVRSGLGSSDAGRGFDDEPRGTFGDDITGRPL